AQQVAALVGRIGRQDVELLPVEHVVVERIARAVVDRRVVVDDGDLPRRAIVYAYDRLVILDQGQKGVVVRHFPGPITRRPVPPRVPGAAPTGVALCGMWCRATALTRP